MPDAATYGDNWFDNDDDGDQQHHLNRLQHLHHNLEPINYYNEDGMSMYFNSDDYTL